MDLCSPDEARQLFCAMDKAGKNSLNFREFHNNFKYAEGETLIQEAHLPRFRKIDKSSEYLKGLPRSTSGQMRDVWKTRNNCGSSANIIASVDGSPGCITEKDRFNVKHDHRQEFLRQEKNIFNARHGNTIKAIADRRFGYENNIMV